MRKPVFGKKARKMGAALAVTGLAVLFFVLMTGFGHTAPANPMEDQEANASRMYLTSSTLAMDQEELEGVENANINSGGNGEETQQEDQEEEDQEDQEEDQQDQSQEENQEDPQDTEDQEEQEEQDQEEDRQTQETNSSPTTASHTSLKSLIRKNQTSSGQSTADGGSGSGSGSGDDSGSGDSTGGNSGGIPSDGGQQTQLNAEQSKTLFTTSLQDDQVTDSAYPFTISLTDKGRQLSLISMNVSLNGSSRACSSSDSLTLQEGENQVYVWLRFRDSKYNQIDASTKVYTIYYIPEGTVSLRVINARSGQDLSSDGTVTVWQDSLWIQVIAEKNKGGSLESVSSRVRLQGVQQKADSDGIYRLKLNPGSQSLTVVADVSGVEQQRREYTVTYKTNSFLLSFESAAVSEKISDNSSKGDKTFGGVTSATYSSTSADFAFRVTCSQDTGLEAITGVQVSNRYGTYDVLSQMGGDGYIHLILDSGQATSIKVICTDSEGETQWYRWDISYRRIVDPSENSKKAPKFDVKLADGETVHSSPYILPIQVYSWEGNKLVPGTNYQVYLNGELLDFSGISPDQYYEYNLYLTEGANTVYITAEDNEQYTAEKTMTIYFSPDAAEVKVHLILSAEVVGLGTMLDEYITVPAGYTLAEIVEERLAAYGYSTIHDGTASDGSYFLRHIGKEGILNGWSISEDERTLLDMEGIYLDEDPAGLSMDSLGEKDFTQGSGWMVTLNRYYIGQSMGTRAVRDGDEIHVIYTLDVGNDIGVDTTGNS